MRKFQVKLANSIHNSPRVPDLGNLQTVYSYSHTTSWLALSGAVDFTLTSLLERLQVIQLWNVGDPFGIPGDLPLTTPVFGRLLLENVHTEGQLLCSERGWLSPTRLRPLHICSVYSSECWGAAEAPQWENGTGSICVPFGHFSPHLAFHSEGSGQEFRTYCTHMAQRATSAAQRTLEDWHEIHLDFAFWAGRNDWGIPCLDWEASRLSFQPEATHVLSFPKLHGGRVPSLRSDLQENIQMFS